MGEDKIVSVDEAMAEIGEIIDKLNTMGASAPGRAKLVARRDELRKAARDAAVASRSEDALRYERDQAWRRLQELDDAYIKESWVERQPTRWINDPGAYASRINEMLEEQSAAEREELQRRIAEIDVQLASEGA